MRKKNHLPTTAPAVISNRALAAVRGGDGTKLPGLRKTGDITLKRG